MGGWFFDNPDGGNAPGAGGGGGGFKAPEAKAANQGHPASQGGIDEGLPESGITSSSRKLETSQPPIMSYGGHDRNKATLACLRNLRIFEELQYQFCSKKVGQYGKAAWCKHLGIGAIFDDDVKINEECFAKKACFLSDSPP